MDVKKVMALTLSPDLVRRIFSQLDCKDLLHCSLVCKQWYKDSTELRAGWIEEYIEVYTAKGFFINRESNCQRPRLEAYLAGSPD